VPSVRRTWAPRGQTPRLVHRYQRDKISAISAVTVSPTHRRLGFYCHLHLENITQVEVAGFLRLLLRHLRGRLIVLWDGGPIHNGAAVRAVLARHPRLQVERFPAYAPDLNPDELAWAFLKGELANGCPLNVEGLLDDLTHLTRRLRRSQRRLRGFVLGSELPPLFSP
jgi:transposase